MPMTTQASSWEATGRQMIWIGFPPSARPNRQPRPDRPGRFADRRRASWARLGPEKYGGFKLRAGLGSLLVVKLEGYN